jgi:hypothetical protein
MLFRMGVNLGDIFWDNEGIYGDEDIPRQLTADFIKAGLPDSVAA